MKHSKVVELQQLITGEYAFVRAFDGGRRLYGAFTAVSEATEKRIEFIVSNYCKSVSTYTPNMSELMTHSFRF